MRSAISSLSIGVAALIFVSGCTALQVGQNVQMGRNALQTGKPEVAVQYFRQASELDPDYRLPYSAAESVWTYLGRAHYELGDFSAARRALETALSKDKDSPVARQYLGLSLLRAGDQQTGRSNTEAGINGVYKLLDRLASNPTTGIYWDPTRQIRSDIERSLGAGQKLEPAELIALAERVGKGLDEEIDNARRDEARHLYRAEGR